MALRLSMYRINAGVKQLLVGSMQQQQPAGGKVPPQPLRLAAALRCTCRRAATSTELRSFAHLRQPAAAQIAQQSSVKSTGCWALPSWARRHASSGQQVHYALH
jgi:hypothetical protein